MFGYVSAAKNQLSAEEYEIFCSYYCGVCSATGREGSQPARLGLSYDITFLAITLSSLSESECTVKESRCIAHPLKKHKSVINDKAIDYAAAMGVLLSYLKLSDDWNDDKNVAALGALMMLKRGYSRAARKYPSETERINEQLKILSRLENEKCESVDEAADAFAEILRMLFTPDFIQDSAEKRALGWMGYNLGRWIYIIDAYNDLESDFKSGSYNPLLASGREPEYYRKEGLETAELSLTFTLENIASAFDLIDFKRNSSLIGKIIYISLKQRQRLVLSGKDKEYRRKGLKRLLFNSGRIDFTEE